MFHRGPKSPGAFGVVLAATLCLLACDPTPEALGEFALSQRLARAQRCQIGVPDAESLARVRAQLARRPLRELQAEVVLESQRSRLGWNDASVWVGSANSPGCESALARLGVERLPGGFRFLGQDYEGPLDGLIATVGDPQRGGAPLAIVLGNDPRRALNWIDDWTPSVRPSWRTLRDGVPQREGRIDLEGRASSADALDFEELSAQLFQGGGSAQREHFRWSAFASFDVAGHAAWFESLDRAAEAAGERMSTFLRDPAELPLALRVFESASDLARVCRASGLAHARERSAGFELSLVALQDGGDNAAFEVARAWTRARAGEPRAAWLLDAVAAASAANWHGRAQADWLAHLWNGGVVPEVGQLVADESELSPHVLAPLRAALLQCCEAQQGANFAVLAWSLPPDRIEIPSDAEFRRWLEQRLAGGIERAQAQRALRRSASLAREDRRGVCLLASPPSGDEFGAGFGSAECERSLIQLAELGANAVAISWCSALEPSPPRSFGSGPAVWSQADDGALLWAMAAARRQGLQIVLLPQLVACENGGFAGQVLLNTPANQRLLFDGWARFLTHLGLCAELAGVDVLSIGGEAPDATFTRQTPENQRSWPQLPIQRGELSRLIENTRRVFSGGLTYASRWDGEAAGIEFWHELDFFAQNVFVPFGDEGSSVAPDSAEFAQSLAASFSRVSKLAEDHGLRGLVTGIGLSSSHAAWREPWRSRGELDLELQKNFYQGLLRALQAAPPGQPFPVGVFTWCWWSDPNAGGPTDRGFTPQNKPAEAVLRRVLRVQ